MSSLSAAAAAAAAAAAHSSGSGSRSVHTSKGEEAPLPCYTSSLAVGQQHFRWHLPEFSALVGWTRYDKRPPASRISTLVHLETKSSRANTQNEAAAEPGSVLVHQIPVDLRMRYRPGEGSLVMAEVFMLLPGGEKGEVTVAVVHGTESYEKKEVYFNNTDSKYPKDYRVYQLSDGLLRPNRALLEGGRALNLEITVTLFGTEDDLAVATREAQAVARDALHGRRKREGSSSASQQLLSIYQSPKIEKDFRIECAGGDVIECHEALLRARSPVLDAMLGNKDTLESQQHRLVLSDIDKETVEDWMYFLYHDSLRLEDIIEDERIYQVLGLADKYDVKLCVQYSEDVLFKRVNVDNVLTTTALADRLRLQLLEKKCLALICAHFDRLKLSSDWETLLSSSPSMAAKIVDAKVGYK